MRKYIKNQLVQLLATLIDGIDYIQTANDANGQIVLNDCLFALDSIKNNFREEVSEDQFLNYEARVAEIIRSLNLFWFAKRQRENLTVAYKQLEQHVIDLQLILQTEAESNYEVVFFPYKASMWDSLESIWRAAQEDPACTCYVIPIPYYERNRDGSLAKLFYEGEQFPKDVPITHYSDYDIAARRPDVTYISNPYDGGNYVTSISPTYYSSELKHHTDMLVYVPYFFTGGDFPDAQANLPAYRYVDKIILQSEDMLKYFTDPTIKEKIMPLGSPKADRMLWLDAHRPTLPQEWAEIIGNKKVVLYNTSISSLLKHGIRVLQKMLFVFQAFKNRDDVVLLWRPHPLSKSTLQSMRPELFDLYLKIEKAFVSEKMGILDTTPDVNTSVVLSDAYIGEDSSSVVHLFGITGKPIFTLNMDIHQLPSEEEKASVSFLDAELYGDELWFVDGGFQALCKMNIHTGKIEVIGQVPAGSASFFPYCDVQKIGNKVIMLPLHAAAICEYDLQEKVFTQIPLKESLLRNNFDRMIRYKDYLYLKPKAYPAIVRYNISNGEVEYYSDCLESFKAHQVAEDEAMFIWAVSVRDNLLLMASAKVNQVLEFDMETGESKIHQVGPEGANYFGMEFDGTDYWLIPYEGRSIIRWNYETSETVEYNHFPAGFKGERQLFVSIVCCGDYLLAFPWTSNMIVRIDRTTGEMSQVSWELPYVEGERRSASYSYTIHYYFAKKINDTCVVALSAFDDRLLIYDIPKEKCSTLECRLDQKDVDNLSRQVIKSGFGQYGNNFMPYNCKEDVLFRRLELFLEYIQSEEGHDAVEQKKAYTGILSNLDGNCGEQIHLNVLLQLSRGREMA